ncbi:MAG: OmpP1/FadL family transporter [Bacteroidia bacterium]
MQRIFLFLICCVFATNLQAGGFQLNAQGQRQLGMGHTGTGLLLNNSTLFFNPGGLVFLDTAWHFSAGASLLFPRTVYGEVSPGIYTSETVHNIGTPFQLYASCRLAKAPKIGFGLGVYTPFGSRVQWPNDWKGQFLIREINLKTIFIQPTLAYQLNEHIGVGAGFVYATGGFSLRKGVPVQDTTGAYGEAVLDGKASGMGFNAGLYLRFNEHWSLGLSYRSAVKVAVENGSADFTVPNSLAEYFPENTFSTSIKLPQVMNVGIGFSQNKWKFAFDINYVGWESYDTLRIDFATNTDKLDDIRSPRQYKNSSIVRFGAEYSFSEKIQLRAGTYLDFTPVQDGYLTPETPDNNRLGITCGASVQLTKNLGTDFSLLFTNAKPRTDTNLETGFTGTFQSRAIAPGFALHYAF